MSLSDFLLREIRDVAERPTREQLKARIASRAPIDLEIDLAAAVRAERDGR